MYADPIKQLAAELFAAECESNGAMLRGGFGFLSPEAQAEYIEKARNQLTRGAECS